MPQVDLIAIVKVGAIVVLLLAMIGTLAISPLLQVVSMGSSAWDALHLKPEQLGGSFLPWSSVEAVVGSFGPFGGGLGVSGWTFPELIRVFAGSVMSAALLVFSLRVYRMVFGS